MTGEGESTYFVCLVRDYKVIFFLRKVNPSDYLLTHGENFAVHGFAKSFAGDTFYALKCWLRSPCVLSALWTDPWLRGGKSASVIALMVQLTKCQCQCLFSCNVSVSVSVMSVCVIPVT